MLRRCRELANRSVVMVGRMGRWEVGGGSNDSVQPGRKAHGPLSKYSSVVELSLAASFLLWFCWLCSLGGGRFCFEEGS